MAGFDHVNPAPAVHETQEPRGARYGRVLFVCYTVLYGAFVLLAAFAPEIMQHTLGGISVAVWYGLALIAAAFLLALFYDWLCRWLAAPNKDQTGEGGK
jgi:uncharacterized membrane protein (DUF485 family)